MNRYSITLGSILLISLITGLRQLYQGDLWGVILILIGGWLLGGLRAPQSTKESPERKVWIITFFGKPTGVVVRGLTLLLNWPWNIIGYIEIELKEVTIDIPLSKELLCQDKAYVSGKIDASITANDQDDPPGTPNWKSASQHLMDFIAIDGYKGAPKQLDTIVTAWCQEIANIRTSEWLERNTVELSEVILEMIKEGRNPNGNTQARGDTDDTMGLGLKITKFQIPITVDDSIRQARNDILKEEAQRRGELADAGTMNQIIEERHDLYDSIGTVRDKQRDVSKVRDELFLEKALKAGKLTVVLNEKGINLVNAGQANHGG
jgi:hypothetical protein